MQEEEMRMRRKEKRNEILQKYKTLVITRGDFKIGGGAHDDPLGMEMAPRMEPST